MGNDVSRAGTAFVVLFVAAFAVGIGELAGSFADADREFFERFADGAERSRDIAGSYLLAFAGLGFVWFAHALSRDAQQLRVPLLAAATVTASGMILAAVAFAAVPMSISFGSLVDDPGLQDGQAVLPQFGYVALTMGAMLPAAGFVVAVARSDVALPPWLRIASYPVAALVACTALLFAPLFLFVGWVVAVVVSQRRARRPQPTQ